jgi:hypothetical protein
LKKSWILVGLGMALYIGAFFLIAAHDAHTSASDRGYPGWFCAVITLINPWGHDGLTLLRESPLQYFALLFSGWINPLFLLTLLAQLVRPKGRLAFVLRIVLLVTFPACWIVFFSMNLYPREGYFAWTAAMLLVVFAVPRARAARKSLQVEPAVDNRVSIS